MSGVSLMETHKLMMDAGIALFAVMAVLLKLGTTSLPLFIAYGVLAIAGLGIAAAGQKMRDGR